MNDCLTAPAALRGRRAKLASLLRFDNMPRAAVLRRELADVEARINRCSCAGTGAIIGEFGMRPCACVGKGATQP